MKTLITVVLLLANVSLFAKGSWLDTLTDPDKQQQMDLRWVASGGEMDIQFIHHKLQLMGIKLSPKPQFPKKRWDANHMVFPIDKNSQLKLQVPYGSIEKVTDSGLKVHTQFSLKYHKKTIKIRQLVFIHNPKKTTDSDIVTFKLLDQFGRHLFNTDHVHIQYSKDRKLLQMKHMDISASKQLAEILGIPELTGQLLGQIHTYSYLDIPKNAQFSLKGGSCFSNIKDETNEIDMELISMGNIEWLDSVTDNSKLYLVPSASLSNVGTADIPWHTKFSGTFPPYNNDQHPYLSWAVYREIDNRFEQIGSSALKHAFFATNVNCPCPGGSILAVGCGDVYGKASNDLSSALGPRNELESFTGIWQSCGSFFDPNCTGNQTQFTGDNTTGENRLAIDPADIVPDLIMQAWYVVRDDINIFNSMGYKVFNPTFSNSIWSTNTNALFNSGSAINHYVPANTLQAMQASQTVSTNEGHFTVAVKVIDLGGGLYRYNYAIDNYDFDPRFIAYHIPMDNAASLSDVVFVDIDKNTSNDWQLSHNNNDLEISGSMINSQDWGMLFSFSFTTNIAPKTYKISIDVAEPILNQSVKATTLAPTSSIFIDGFEY